MRRPRPLRPWRAADLAVPATAIAAITASLTLVWACSVARDPEPLARASAGVARAPTGTLQAGTPGWPGR